MRALRLYIRSLIREMKEKEGDKPDNLLTEPDEVDERDEDSADEVSAVSAIAGATTPLGTGPTYPTGAKRKKKKLPKGWQKSK